MLPLLLLVTVIACMLAIYAEAYATLLRIHNVWGYFVKVGDYQEFITTDTPVRTGVWYVCECMPGLCS
jgi:hypothetical protein